MFSTRLVLAGVAAFFISLQYGSAGPLSDDPNTIDAGFRHMYNLDFSSAHKTFETWQELHPEDPLGAASNAAAYLFSEFERLHVLDIDLFTDNQRFDKQDKLSPDPDIKLAFQRELAKADAISERILAQSPTDPDALFVRMLTDGLRGNYVGLVEKRKGDALDLLKSSRTVAEKLIAIDPDCTDAYLAVGIENYLLGLRSAPVRWLLRASGAQANKSKGLENLQITAEKGHPLAPYARLLLAIAALRDQDRITAKKLLSALASEFPQNHLYQSELSRLES